MNRSKVARSEVRPKTRPSELKGLLGQPKLPFPEPLCSKTTASTCSGSSERWNRCFLWRRWDRWQFTVKGTQSWCTVPALVLLPYQNHQITLCPIYWFHQTLYNQVLNLFLHLLWSFIGESLPACCGWVLLKSTNSTTNMEFCHYCEPDPQCMCFKV